MAEEGRNVAEEGSRKWRARGGGRAFERRCCCFTGSGLYVGVWSLEDGKQLANLSCT